MLRRTLLWSVLGAAVGACVRPSPREAPRAVQGLMQVQERWEQEARGILSDALETLRTFEIFAAYRVGGADQESLAWDPPTTAAWDEATHVTRGLNGRAEQLFSQVSSAQIDASAWRERRDLAEATYGLIQLGEALGAYRARVDHLGPGGDGTGAWGELDRAWAVWDANAARWALSRAEPIACAP